MLWQAELSVLLDALEQSACNTEVADVLTSSLVRILELSPEKSIASFKTLEAVPRVLKVACIQAQESRKFGNISPFVDSNVIGMIPSHAQQTVDSHETAQKWLRCMETSMGLFMKFFSVADDARILVLHSSSCIDCLFDLFWEESLRNHVLKHILELMKVYLQTVSILYGFYAIVDLAVQLFFFFIFFISTAF